MSAASRPMFETLLLGAWLGASILLAAVVAPAAFAVLPSRTLAGALVGRVLPALFVSGAVIAGLLLAAGYARLPHVRLPRAIFLGIIVLACGIAQFVVTPRIARLREAIGGAIDALSTDDARRAAFGQLHGISIALLGLAMFSAVVVICADVFAAWRLRPLTRSY
jgi:hypothetical protein